jgi:hypothetical protein
MPHDAGFPPVSTKRHTEIGQKAGIRLHAREVTTQIDDTVAAEARRLSQAGDPSPAPSTIYRNDVTGASHGSGEGADRG